jgi:hypothetical protein
MIFHKQLVSDDLPFFLIFLWIIYARLLVIRWSLIGFITLPGFHLLDSY